MADEQELSIIISGDSSGGQEAAQSMATSVQSSIDQQLSAVDALGSEYDDLTGVITNTSVAAAGLGDSFGSAADDFAGVTSQVQDTKSWLDELVGSVEGIGGLGDSIRSGLEDPFGTAKDAVNGFLETLGPVGIGVGALAAGVLAAGDGLKDLAESAAKTAESQLQFSRITGANIEDVGGLQAAAEIGGSSLDGLQSMLMQVQRRMDATGPAAEKFNAALANLGVNADAFRAADPTSRIEMLSTAMHDSAGNTNLMSDAIAIMGRGAMSNLPFLMKDFEDLKARGDEVGLTLSQTDAEAAEKFSENTKELSVQMKTLTDQVGMMLIPAMSDLMGAFDYVLEHAKNVFPEILTMLSALGGPLTFIPTALGVLTLAIVDNVKATADAQLKAESWGAVMDTMSHLWALATKAGLDNAASQEQVAQQMLNIGYKAPVVAAAVGMTVEQINALKKANDDAAASGAKFVELWSRIDEAESNSGATTQGLSKATQDYINHLNDEGFKVQEIADALHLTTGQITAVEVAHTKAATAADKQKASIDALVSSLEGDTKSTALQVQAIQQVIKAGTDDEDVKKRVLDLITKLEAKNINLTASIYQWQEAQKQNLDTTTIGITELDKYNATVDYANQTGVAFATAQATMAHSTQALGLALPVARFSDFHSVLTGVEDQTGLLVSEDIPQATGALENLGTDTDYAAQKTQGLKDALSGLRSQLEGSSDLVTAFDGALKQLPQELEKSFEGGGNWEGAIKAFGTKFGSLLGNEISSPEGPIASMLPEAFDNVIGGAIGAIAGGGVGSLVSAGISKLVSWIANIGGPSQEELQGRQTESTFEQSFGGFQGMMDAVGTAYSKMGLTAQQAQSDVQSLLNAEKQGSAATQDWITKIQGVITAANNLGTDGATAATQFGTGIKVITDALTAQTNDTQTLADLNTQMATASASQQASIQTQITAVNNDLFVQQGILDATFPKTAQGASAMADAVVADFGSMIKNGVDFSTAVKDIQPSVTEMEQVLQKAGVTGDAAFNQLSQMVDLTTDKIAGPALTSLQNLIGGMGTLSSMGLMNQSTFAGLGDQIGQTFTSLVSQGYDGNSVLVSMQAQIQEVWQEQQKYGFTLDDTTQKIVDQAVQQGIVGPQMEDVNTQLLNVLTDIDNTLKSMTASTNAFSQAVNNIPSNKTVDISYDVSGSAQGAGTTGIPSFANRPMEAVTSTGYALLHPGDVVGVPQSGQLGFGGSPQTHALLGQVADGIDGMRSDLTDLPNSFARKVRDAIQLAG